MFTIFFNMLFPVNCGVCNGSVEMINKYGICVRCAQEIEVINSNGCKFCGKPVSFEGIFCRLCTGKDSRINKAYTACYYKDSVKTLIINFKYNDRRYLVKFLGKLLFELYETYLKDEKIDLIIPVPLSPAKKKIRGFNQAEILSKYLTKKTGIKTKGKVLMRVRNTVPQFNLTRNERFKNIKGAFKSTKNLSGKNILLIDDVATTGATIQNSASALKESGADRIFALLIAHGK